MFNTFSINQTPRRGIASQVAVNRWRAGVITCPEEDRPEPVWGAQRASLSSIDQFSQYERIAPSPIHWSPTPPRSVAPVVLVQATQSVAGPSRPLSRVATERSSRVSERQALPKGSRFRFSSAKYFLTYAQVSNASCSVIRYVLTSEDRGHWKRCPRTILYRAFCRPS